MEQPAGTIGFREVDPDGNPVGGEVQPGEEDQPDRRLIAAVNPFIVVLWVVAAVLVGGGGSTFLNANFAAMSGAVPISFLLMTFAPYAIFIGLAAVIGLLFWHANQWQRRRNRDS